MLGSRGPRRAERRKRKPRPAEPATGTRDPAPVSAPKPADPRPAEEAESFQDRMARRSEERNVVARAELKPLAEGERPRVVTIGAVISGLIALIFTSSAVVAAVGSVEVNGEVPNPIPLAAVALVSWM